MAAYTSTLSFYNNFLLNLAKVINLETDTIQVGLVTSAYTPDASNHAVLADITNEVTGSGYARQTITTQSLTLAAGAVTFDFDDVVFTATGGSIIARRFFVFDDTVATPTKPLIGFGLIDDTNLDVEVTSGNTLTLQIHVNGLLNIQEV